MATTIETAMIRPNHLIAYFGHHKCGTRWVIRILRQVLSGLSLKLVEYHNDTMFDQDLRRALESVGADCLCYTNAQRKYVAQLTGYKGFHVIRDPRDIVVSAYFSHLYSHPTENWTYLNAHRDKLTRLSKEDGLFFEMTFLRHQFEAMYKWDYSMAHVLELKFEDLIHNPYTWFIDALRFVGLMHPSVNEPIQCADSGSWLSEERLMDIVYSNRFAALAKGRTPGEEDTKSHYRKGVAGDWRNHFSANHARLFEEQYGNLLRKLGYETSSDWTTRVDDCEPRRLEDSQRLLVKYFEVVKGQLAEYQQGEAAIKIQLEAQRANIQDLTLRLANAEGSVASLLEQRDYSLLVGRIQTIVKFVVPGNASIAVVSKGDDDLVCMDGRRAWHMPQAEDGSYLGQHPADSDEAITHLERVRQTGADYLLIPETSFWWLDYYAEFRDHLEGRYRCIWSDGTCRVYMLRESGR